MSEKVVGKNRDVLVEKVEQANKQVLDKQEALAACRVNNLLKGYLQEIKPLHCENPAKAVKLITSAIFKLRVLHGNWNVNEQVEKRYLAALSAEEHALIERALQVPYKDSFNGIHTLWGRLLDYSNQFTTEDFGHACCR